MADQNDLLMCPILQTYFEDPITLPCCGKTISRQPLIDHFNASGHKICPCCRGDNANFDPVAAPTSKDMVYLVEQAMKAANPQAPAAPNPAAAEDRVAKWKGKIIRLQDANAAYQKVIGRLEITNTNNAFNFKTLIIPVIDESGSMSGNPITQARYACQQVLNVVYQNPNLETSIVSYESTAQTIHIDKKLPIEIGRAHV